MYQLKIMHMKYCMIQKIHAANYKRFWFELHSKNDLFINIYIFLGHIFLSKNRYKTPQN